MNAKFNPFQPNSPVAPGTFVGRLKEILSLEQALGQTRCGQPKHFMLVGERGIGKTSLLDYIRRVAQGELDTLDDEKFHFLVVDVDVEKGTTPASLARKMQRAIDRQLGSSEKARTFLRSTWDFLTRIEAFGVSLDAKSKATSDEDLLDELAYSLAATMARVCADDGDERMFASKYDGIFICIDEADRASPNLDLGALLKLLTERLHKRGCDRLVVGLAGLPDLREVLRESHASALRIFEEIQLGRLADEEVGKIVDRCLEKANEKNPTQTTIGADARSILIWMSEGYPHFVQQFGYCAFDADTDNVISLDDATTGAFAPAGALRLIGDRYYRDNFYGKIQKESYRQVLRIMASNLDGWISKEDIRARFDGKKSVLSNALQALRERHIVLSKEGDRGVYRLQHKGFALWIKLQGIASGQVSLPFPSTTGDGTKSADAPTSSEAD